MGCTVNVEKIAFFSTKHVHDYTKMHKQQITITNASSMTGFVMQYVMSKNVINQKQLFQVTFHMVSNNACIILSGGLDLVKLLKHA